jgi:hypothetical protein
MFEARNQADVKSEAMYQIKKIPKTKIVFGDTSNQTRESLVTFFYPDYTVGFGISPNHARTLVGCTTDRELHPAPKVIKLCAL